MKTFAVVPISGGVVSNIVAGENKEEVSQVVGECIEQNEETGNAEIGSLWNGSIFIKKPYPSWIVGENFNWQAPISMPEISGPWIWNEDLLNWEDQTQSVE